MRRRATISCVLGLIGLTACWSADSGLAKDTKIVLIAGRKSHAPGEHEYGKGLNQVPLIGEKQP